MLYHLVIFLAFFHPTLVFGSEQDVGRELLLNNNSSLGGKLILGANKLFNKFGILECNGLEGVTRGTFFHQLFGNRPSLGNALCEPTCQGQCVPLRNVAEAPSTVSYAFGCQCPGNRCGGEGPIVDSLADPKYRIACQLDSTCSCTGVTPTMNLFGIPVPQRGYLCNWMNTDSSERITFDNLYQRRTTFEIPTHLPVSWCSCCPED